MSVLRRSTAGLVVMALAAGASAREPLVLKPISPWNLQYKPESCRLVRAFGDPNRPTVMVLERISPGSPLSLLVYGGGLRSQMGDEGVTAAFLPFAANRFSALPVAETSSAKDPAIHWSGIMIRPQALTDKERKARGLLGARPHLGSERAGHGRSDRCGDHRARD